MMTSTVLLISVQIFFPLLDSEGASDLLTVFLVRERGALDIDQTQGCEKFHFCLLCAFGCHGLLIDFVCFKINADRLPIKTN